MSALLRPTIHSLWMCSTRASFGHVRSGPLDIVHSYAFGFLHSVLCTRLTATDADVRRNSEQGFALVPTNAS